MAKKLYVGSLPYETTDEELKEHFSSAGPIVSANIIMDKFSGRSKGFGFVEFEKDEDAQKAVEQFNGSELGGRKLVVNEARPMTDRKPHGGGGGFRGGRGGDRGGFNRGGSDF